jgi:phage terminase large subunit GpA-like protein
VDVQHGCIYVVETGWGASNYRAHIVDNYRLDIDVTTSEGRAAFAQMVHKSFPIEGSGHKIAARLTLVDSGDQTSEVYALCNGFHESLVRPVKGTSDKSQDEITSGENHLFTRTKDQNAPHRGRLINCGSYKMREFVSRLMMRPPGGEGAVSFHAGVAEDEDFQKQWVSEHRTTIKGKSAWKRRPGYHANHYWDAGIYATCGALVCGLGAKRMGQTVEAQVERAARMARRPTPKAQGGARRPPERRGW